MKAKILWIEGKRAEGPSFIPALRKKEFLEIETVSSGSAALERAAELNPDLVVVNAASLRSSGKRICRSLREKLNGLPIILITSQASPNQGDTGATSVLVLPFTARKLMNRITPFLPGKGDDQYVVGAIRLDIEKKQVSCEGREARLTPRLARILQILMSRHGEVVEREQLFREVWKTEYTVDTRTLDVHVSWLRQAIEEDPRNPKFLKTVRKVGYRLDV
jgi:DNA-binding response OmpR family regulator